MARNPLYSPCRYRAWPSPQPLRFHCPVACCSLPTNVDISSFADVLDRVTYFLQTIKLFSIKLIKFRVDICLLSAERRGQQYKPKLTFDGIFCPRYDNLDHLSNNSRSNADVLTCSLNKRKSLSR